MSKTQIVTLSIPAEFKKRLEVEARMANKSYAALKLNVTKILDSVEKDAPVPEWDKLH